MTMQSTVGSQDPSSTVLELLESLLAKGSVNQGIADVSSTTTCSGINEDGIEEDVRSTGFIAEPSWDARLDREFFSFTERVSLTDAEKVDNRRMLHDVLRAARGAISEDCTIEVFGSAASGLCERGSDIDATIVVRMDSMRKRFREVVERNADPWLLCSLAVREIAQWVERNEKGILLVEKIISSAKVPIVCLADVRSGQIIDVSINNVLPTHNTALLRSYGHIDGRIRALILCVKRWAKLCNVSDAKNGNLSSYSWSLLVIYYLQVSAGLPSLQQLGLVQDNRRVTCPLTNRSFDVRFAPPLGIRWDCPHSISELFRGFFAFYSTEFQWADEVASIRIGERYTTEKYPRLANKMREFHIEDPFDIYRNLNCVLDPFGVARLRTAIDTYAIKMTASAQELLCLAKQLCAVIIPASTAIIFTPGRGSYRELTQTGTVDMW